MIKNLIYEEKKHLICIRKEWLMTLSSTNRVGQLDSHMKNKENWPLPQTIHKTLNQLDGKAK